MNRVLVISPQAGLGNRLRALSSALVLGQQLGRTVLHAWYPVPPNDPRPHVVPLQQFGYGALFTQDDALPVVDRRRVLELGFSEWIPGDYWYPFQSHAQRSLPVRRMARVPNPADAAARVDVPGLLIETSHCLRLSPSLGGHADDAAFDAARHAACRTLTPRAPFVDWLDTLPDVDAGIAIRRGDLLQYAPEANQGLDEICAWARRIAKGRRVTVFSDDAAARRRVQDAIPGYEHHPALERELDARPLHESAFLQFLYLARKCAQVCGTPGSSFAQEAAVFGGRPFRPVLCPALSATEEAP